MIFSDRDDIAIGLVLIVYSIPLNTFSSSSVLAMFKAKRDVM